MNGISEPLPGLLDDPLFQITDLPLTDFHIAPLRDPAPPRHSNAPPPLEPVARNAPHQASIARQSAQTDSAVKPTIAPTIVPNDVLHVREWKKPHLAISELLEDNDSPDYTTYQLPSFVSLSVVERSPIQPKTLLDEGHVHKRPRLEQDVEITSFDVGRQLPRPAQKEQSHPRPTPLLPAMVTGLHEPPPSAALLPSMDPDQRSESRPSKTSKIHVKDILMDCSSRSPSPHRPRVAHEQTVTTIPTMEDQISSQATISSASLQYTELRTGEAATNKEAKARRARRKWTAAETEDLMAGVRKYGVGKWKQILDDTTYRFDERNSVDLKDRYRVCSKDDPSMLLVTPTLISPVTSPKSSDPFQSFQSKTRRKRRAWTSAEDDALLKGVGQYGFRWSLICEDPVFDLGHRRATDLRDRIRNKFPDGYKHAKFAPLTTAKMRKAQKLEKMTTDQQAQNQTGLPTANNADKRDRDKDQAGVTLPSLALDDDDMDWDDNRLPPLLPWDEAML